MEMKYPEEIYAERVKELEVALRDLLEDTQHKDHDCGDEEWCPVLRGWKVLGGSHD